MPASVLYSLTHREGEREKGGRAREEGEVNRERAVLPSCAQSENRTLSLGEAGGAREMERRRESRETEKDK